MRRSIGKEELANKRRIKFKRKEKRNEEKYRWNIREGIIKEVGTVRTARLNEDRDGQREAARCLRPRCNCVCVILNRKYVCSHNLWQRHFSLSVPLWHCGSFPQTGLSMWEQPSAVSHRVDASASPANHSGDPSAQLCVRWSEETPVVMLRKESHKYVHVNYIFCTSAGGLVTLSDYLGFMKSTKLEIWKDKMHRQQAKRKKIVPQLETSRVFSQELYTWDLNLTSTWGFMECESLKPSTKTQMCQVLGNSQVSQTQW